ncbi:DUF4279 domain-containing protein [Scytonema sp. UIC 10036]|nr:DUF4279 domain-containing protein [Scytonema sp. UIC 10036]
MIYFAKDWLNLLEELTQTLGIKPTKFVRRGERVSKKRVQPVDLWILELDFLVYYFTFICLLYQKRFRT